MTYHVEPKKVVLFPEIVRLKIFLLPTRPHDHPKKKEHVLKNKLWKAFVYICLLYVSDENQDMLLQY